MITVELGDYYWTYIILVMGYLLVEHQLLTIIITTICHGIIVELEVYPQLPSWL